MTPLGVWSSLYFFGFTGAISLIRIDDFYNLVFFTTVASGLAFTLPVFLVLLVRFNIVSTKLFTKNRLYLYIAVYVLTGVVTPDGNPVSDILLFTPIILLMEGALLVARRYDKQQPAESQKLGVDFLDRKSTRLNSSHVAISYAVFCLKKKKKKKIDNTA